MQTTSIFQHIFKREGQSFKDCWRNFWKLKVKSTLLMFGEVTFWTNGVVVLVIRESNSRTGSFKTGILEHAKRLRLHQTHTYISIKWPVNLPLLRFCFCFYVFNVEGNVILKSSAWTFISFRNEFAYLGDITTKFSIKFILEFISLMFVWQSGKKLMESGCSSFDFLKIRHLFETAGDWKRFRLLLRIINNIQT